MREKKLPVVLYKKLVLKGNMDLALYFVTFAGPSLINMAINKLSGGFQAIWATFFSVATLL